MNAHNFECDSEPADTMNVNDTSGGSIRFAMYHRGGLELDVYVKDVDAIEALATNLLNWAQDKRTQAEEEAAQTPPEDGFYWIDTPEHGRVVTEFKNGGCLVNMNLIDWATLYRLGVRLVEKVEAPDSPIQPGVPDLTEEEQARLDEHEAAREFMRQLLTPPKDAK